MSKPELGTKRLCASCGVKFYDLHHNPIVCPKCGTVHVPPMPAARAGVMPHREAIVPGKVPGQIRPDDTQEAVVGAADEEADVAENSDNSAFVEPDEDEDGEGDVGNLLGEQIPPRDER